MVCEISSTRRQALLWESLQLFFQIIQASFKVGQFGRGDFLTTTPRPTLCLNLGLLCVAPQALQLYAQLIECGIDARQITPGSSLGLLELRNAITQLLHPCRRRLVVGTTLTLQGCRVSLHHLQCLYHSRSLLSDQTRSGFPI